MTHDKELDQAAEEYAERMFKELRGISPDEFTWKDSQFGRELLMMFQAFVSGGQFQQSRTVPDEWGKVRDEQYSHFEQSGSVLQKTVGTGYLLGFDVALDLIARPLLKRCEEIEARLAEAMEVLRFYAIGSSDLEPKPEKAHLYEKNYAMGSHEWNQRSMSDYWSGKRAREALEKLK